MVSLKYFWSLLIFLLSFSMRSIEIGKSNFVSIMDLINKIELPSPIPGIKPGPAVKSIYLYDCE